VERHTEKNIIKYELINFQLHHLILKILGERIKIFEVIAYLVKFGKNWKKLVEFRNEYHRQKSIYTEFQ